MVFNKFRISILTFLLISSFHLLAQNTTGTVNFDVSYLHDLNQITVTLSDNTSLVLTRTEVVYYEAGGYSWIGIVDTYPESSVIISVVDDEAGGFIETLRRYWKLRITSQTQNVVEEVDITTFVIPEDSISELIFKNGFGDNITNKIGLSEYQSGTTCTDNVIEILFLHTQEASVSGSYPSLNFIKIHIDNAIEMANQDFKRSGISTRVKAVNSNLILVNSNHIPSAESNPNGNGNNRLNATRYRMISKTDGFMDEIHDLRNTYKADLTILITDFGIGYASIYENDWTVAQNNESAFGLVNAAWMIQNHTFTHEIGHLLGALHDRIQVGKEQQALPANLPGSSYGFNSLTPATGYRTIMAYADACIDNPNIPNNQCKSIGTFSSPNITVGNIVMGDTNNDNRNRVLEVAPIVACYRPLFTKLDITGNVLPDSATSWACARSNTTGLIWEVKTDDGGIHDKDNTYRWGGVGSLGNDDGLHYSEWDSLVNGSNSAGFCGGSDWRVPSIEELKTIIEYGTRDPSINTSYFPNTVSSNYWSASPSTNNIDGAQIINFHYGTHHDYFGRWNPLSVRLVRFGQ